jgi:hypothetical protein
MAATHYGKCEQWIFHVHGIPLSVTLAAQFSNVLFQKPVEVKKQIK